jgi:glycosyltransferase involved in cell wall biosynthesis
VRLLYIAYFGALKHLSESQVLPYLRELADAGLGVSLLTFEELPADARLARMETASLASRLCGAGIDWKWLRYHKRPSIPATAFDITVGTLVSAFLILRKRIDVVHARTHVPGLVALVLRALFGVKIVFDLRGLMADEYVEAGVWRKDGISYRLTKWVERHLLRTSDAIVVLTHQVVRVLENSSADFRARRGAVEVIPTCVDLEKYVYLGRERMRRELRLPDAPTMIYVGSLGGWYMTEEIVQLYLAGRIEIPHLRFLVVTQSPHELMQNLLEMAEISEDNYTIRTARPSEMPGYLSSADVGVHLIRPGLSMVANSPTKFGEYLACGVPIVTNAGIGDCDEYIIQDRVGVTIKSLNPEGYREAWGSIRELLGESELAARCRKVAERRFSLKTTGREGYLRVYRRLGYRDGGASTS